MGWVAITEADLVANGLSGAELAGYRAAALGAEQPDPVAAQIAQVTREVRGYVKACQRNRVPAGETIPASLMRAACNILAVDIPKRVGKDPKAGRKEAKAEAIKLLERVASCGFDIDEDGAESGSGMSLVSSTRRKATREKMNGL